MEDADVEVLEVVRDKVRPRPPPPGLQAATQGCIHASLAQDPTSRNPSKQSGPATRPQSSVLRRVIARTDCRAGWSTSQLRQWPLAQRRTSMLTGAGAGTTCSSTQVMAPTSATPSVVLYSPACCETSRTLA